MIKFHHKNRKDVVYWIPKLQDKCEVYWNDIYTNDGYLESEAGSTTYDLPIILNNFKNGVWVKLPTFKEYYKQAIQL